MNFLEIINQKKITIISIFLFLYIFINLLEGERGLISYIDKKNIKKQLIKKEKVLISKLEIIEKQNILLTEKIDLDYIEILYRKKFMLGKSSEKIFAIKN
jgi:cell division protein DivIC